MNFRENDMELNELPDDLIALRHKPTYVLPFAYFNELADEILSKIQMPVLAEIPFSAPPADYFDGLASAVLLKVKAQNSSKNEVQKEIEEIDSFIASIPKSNLYKVPEDYFQSFTVNVQPIKKSTSVKRLFGPASWTSYAAAAIVTAIIGLSIFFGINQQPAVNNADAPAKNNYTKQLANLPDHEISDYLDNTAAEGDMIQTTQEGASVTNSESLYKTLLNNVSDNEIQQYLNENDGGNEKNIKGI